MKPGQTTTTQKANEWIFYPFSKPKTKRSQKYKKFFLSSPQSQLGLARLLFLSSFKRETEGIKWSQAAGCFMRKRQKLLCEVKGTAPVTGHSQIYLRARREEMLINNWGQYNSQDISKYVTLSSVTDNRYRLCYIQRSIKKEYIASDTKCT